MSIAAVFDPRVKFHFLNIFKKVCQSEDEVYQQIERVRSELVNLFDDYTSTLSSHFLEINPFQRVMVLVDITKPLKCHKKVRVRNFYLI